MTRLTKSTPRELSRDEIIARLREGILAARADVVGIILFGSFARGEAWHDVDVLVVLEKLESGRLAWTNIAVALGRAVSFPMLEVIPYSLSSFRKNLRNHIPFLLDVATDGIILYDRANLTELIAETKRYILERGIRRTRTGGWRFPVKYRQSTFLSTRSNEDYVRRWLADAQRDLQAAQVLHKTGLYDRSVYHCQQAVERAVKAVLACFGGFERSHFVAKDLYKEIEAQVLGEHRESLLQLADTANRLEKHVSRSRYISLEDEDEEEIWDPAEQYFETDSSIALKDANEALRVADEFIAWWFTPSEQDN
jgi:HEPN domain-containing protein/predicted nucleotidyltransferase